MEIRDTCRPQGEAGNGETVRKRERLEREKKGATTWYVRVGCSRRTYHIGNAVEDIKSSSTICQSPLTGSFHLSSFYSIFIFCPPNVGGLARDVPTPRGDTTRLLTHSPPPSIARLIVYVSLNAVCSNSSPLSLSLSLRFSSPETKEFLPFAQLAKNRTANARNDRAQRSMRWGKKAWLFTAEKRKTNGKIVSKGTGKIKKKKRGVSVRGRDRSMDARDKRLRRTLR